MGGAISNGQWARNKVHHGQVPSPSQGNKYRRDTYTHMHTPAQRPKSNLKHVVNLTCMLLAEEITSGRTRATCKFQPEEDLEYWNEDRICLDSRRIWINLTFINKHGAKTQRHFRQSAF